MCLHIRVENACVKEGRQPQLPSSVTWSTSTSSDTGSPTVRLDWLSHESQWSACLWLLGVGILSLGHHTWHFYMGTQVLTVAISTSLTKSSSQALLFLIKIKSYMYVNVCVWHVMYIQVPSEAEEAIGCPGPGAMNSCELSDGAGNGTQVGPRHTQRGLPTTEPRSSPYCICLPCLGSALPLSYSSCLRGGPLRGKYRKQSEDLSCIGVAEGHYRPTSDPCNFIDFSIYYRVLKNYKLRLLLRRRASLRNALFCYPSAF